MTSHTVVDHFEWCFGDQNELKGHGTTFPTSACFSLIWDIGGRMEGLTEPIFLPFMCHLRVLEINIDSSSTMHNLDILSFVMRSLCISLTSPATLEHLTLDITFEGDDCHFDYDEWDEFCMDLRDADFWKHLDSVITHPTGSRLQRVDINIGYAFYDDDDMVEVNTDEILSAVHDGLPLLREKGILFVEPWAGW